MMHGYHLHSGNLYKSSTSDKIPLNYFDILSAAKLKPDILFDFNPLEKLNRLLDNFYVLRKRVMTIIHNRTHKTSGT